jgi:hypothetical protein
MPPLRGLLLLRRLHGAILADNASTLASIIASFVKTIEVAELEGRLSALEQANAGAPGACFDA